MPPLKGRPGRSDEFWGSVYLSEDSEYVTVHPSMTRHVHSNQVLIMCLDFNSIASRRLLQLHTGINRAAT
jgi:hypothetical protein